MYHVSDMLWTSPELLADKNHRKTKEADVYGFGIILHEVFYRMGPFAGKDHLTPKGMEAKSLMPTVHKARPYQAVKTPEKGTSDKGFSLYA